MNSLNNVCETYCISNASREKRVKHKLHYVDPEIVSTTELSRYFDDNCKQKEHCELLSSYHVWKKLSTSKRDQHYLIFHGQDALPTEFTILWNNFLSKNLPKDFFICSLGNHSIDLSKDKTFNKYNDYFYSPSDSSCTNLVDSNIYIISKRAANLVSQHINNEGFKKLDNNFILNFFIKNKFFSAPEKVFLLENPIVINSSTDNKFHYTEDKLFKKRTALIDIRCEWESLVKENEFNQWLAHRPHLPDINPNTYPIAPKEKFSCYNPGQSTAMVTLYTDQTKSYSYQSEISIKNYCLKNNYTFYVYRDSIDMESFPSWSKPEALLNHIDSHENIVWIDSDTLIFNPDKKLEWIIDGDCTKFKMLILSEDLCKDNYINSGVIMCRNSEHTKDILNRWKDFKKNNDTSSLYASQGDQVVLGDVIKKSDIFKYNHKVFPMSKFNTDPRLVNWDTFILHFMAYPKHLKNYFLNFWNLGFPIYK
jgi:hypothetical protein